MREVYQSRNFRPRSSSDSDWRPSLTLRDSSGQVERSRGPKRRTSSRDISTAVRGAKASATSSPSRHVLNPGYAMELDPRIQMEYVEGRERIQALAILLPRVIIFSWQNCENRNIDRE